MYEIKLIVNKTNQYGSLTDTAEEERTPVLKETTMKPLTNFL